MRQRNLNRLRPLEILIGFYEDAAKLEACCLT